MTQRRAVKRRAPVLDRFTGMEVLPAVARCGTFATAAEDMGLSPAIAGKHVEALDDHFGVRPFDRTRWAIRLTEAGREYDHRFAAVLHALEAVENRTSSVAADVRATAAPRVRAAPPPRPRPG